MRNITEETLKLLKENRLFFSMETDEIKSFLKNIDYKIKDYKKDEVIAIEEDRCISLGLILKGTIEIQRIFDNGKKIIIKKLVENDVFGEALIFSGRNNYPATIVATSKAEIMYMDNEEIIDRFKENEIFLRNFLSLLSEKVIILNDKIRSIGFKSIRHKIINYILEESKIQGSSRIIIGLNREELAEYLDMPRPSLSRELIKLKKDEFIDFDKKTISIINKNGLEEELFI